MYSREYSSCVSVDVIPPSTRWSVGKTVSEKRKHQSATSKSVYAFVYHHLLRSVLLRNIVVYLFGKALGQVLPTHGARPRPYTGNISRQQ